MRRLMTDIEKYINEAYNHGDFDDWYEAHYGVFSKDFEDLDTMTKLRVCDNFNKFLNRD